MKILLGELVAANPELVQLGQKELPFKAAYCISKLLRKVGEEVKDYETARGALVKELGEQQGDMWQVKPENFESFSKKLEELLTEEVELNGIRKLKLEELDGVPVRPQMLAALHFFIDEDAV